MPGISLKGIEARRVADILGVESGGYTEIFFGVCALDVDGRQQNFWGATVHDPEKDESVALIYRYKDENTAGTTTFEREIIPHPDGKHARNVALGETRIMVAGKAAERIHAEPESEKFSNTELKHDETEIAATIQGYRDALYDALCRYMPQHARPFGHQFAPHWSWRIEEGLESDNYEVVPVTGESAEKIFKLLRLKPLGEPVVEYTEYNESVGKAEKEFCSILAQGVHLDGKKSIILVTQYYGGNTIVISDNITQKSETRFNKAEINGTYIERNVDGTIRDEDTIAYSHGAREDFSLRIGRAFNEISKFRSQQSRPGNSTNSPPSPSPEPA